MGKDNSKLKRGSTVAGVNSVDMRKKSGGSENEILAPSSTITPTTLRNKTQKQFQSDDEDFKHSEEQIKNS